MKIWKVVGIAVLVLSTITSGFLLSMHIPNSSLSFETGELDVEVVIENAFPNLSFQSITDLQSPDDGNDILYVVEKAGYIVSFDNRKLNTLTSLFLDITDKVNSTKREQGLLGLAFHPEFAENRYFYIYYTSLNGNVVLSRMTATNSFVDPSTEVILLSIPWPGIAHHGGQLVFDNDGYLYLTIGDGGFPFDPDNNAQNRRNLLGSMLRIDVDSTTELTNYSIPSDNPYYENSRGYREEIYAYGFRHLWRFSIDRVTGDIWTGDVGSFKKEEINKVEAGKNYGWNFYEGSECLKFIRCDLQRVTPPLFEYEHNGNFAAVIGGHVYRGTQLPDLYGVYIFSDFVSGIIWGLTQMGGEIQVSELPVTQPGIQTFGVDNSGELFLCTSSQIFSIVSSTNES